MTASAVVMDAVGALASYRRRLSDVEEIISRTDPRARRARHCLGVYAAVIADIGAAERPSNKQRLLLDTHATAALDALLDAEARDGADVGDGAID